MVSFFSNKKAYISVLAVIAISLSSVAFADTFGPVTPTADGFYRQWTPKSGSTHYTMVDEATCNGTTDYNRTTTVGARDSYAVSLGSVPDGSSITQISITPCASKHKSGGSNSTMKVFYRFSGVNSADAGGYSLAGTTPVSLATTNFTGLSHVKSAASALEIGAVLTAGGKGARLGRIAVQITYTVLNVPSGLSAIPSGTQVTLNWADNSANEDGFKIERSADGLNFSEIVATAPNATSYTDTGSVANTSYWYRVYAFNGAGNSAYSNTVKVGTVPAAPGNLTTTPNGGGVVILNWVDNALTETHYHVERKTSGTGSFMQIGGDLDPNTTTHPDYAGSGEHTYRVRTSNDAGFSDYSNEATIIVP